ncbi:MAG: OmpH family outer membrane protein [Planctomycetes bacterium]|nr:OmpH family outer membrane protein [Planctomycetota bacterium]
MKRFSLLAVVMAALAAGFLGSVVKDVVFAPKAADAQVTQKPDFKIALLDLERVSRASKKFRELKVEWEAVQAKLKSENDKTVNEFESLKNKLRRAQNEGETEQAMGLRNEATAMEESMKAIKEVQKNYLSELIEQYQKQVLDEVLAAAESYCTTRGYHLVLQDYEVKKSDSELFAGGSYSERLLNKPVLFAPGVIAKTNPYVTDITEAVEALVKG